MEIAPEVFAKARKLNRPAVEALFAGVFPSVVRMARGLCGREDVAEGVVRFVMVRAAAILPKWRDATAAERWFLHHTVLTARRAVSHEPTAKGDLLATGSADARYLAFVRALRQLPFQQREAVTLHYGEKFNPRYLAVAMDCSTGAAQTHLDAGVTALRMVAGNDFQALIDHAAAAYNHLGPAPDAVMPSVGRWVRKGLRPHRLRRLARRAVIVLLLLGLAFAAWKWRARLGW